MDMFSALLGKSLSGGGGSEPVLITKSISSNGTYDASDDNADGYSSVSVSVPNSYTAADEDKVVHNGALVAQGSDTVTQNGTVDTTLISSLVVNVSGGSGVPVKLSTETAKVTVLDMYIFESETQIYIFGYKEGNPTNYTIVLDIPDSFDMSKLGTFKGGCGCVVFSSATSDRIYSLFTPDTQNKKISFTVTSGFSFYIGVFAKAT